VGRFQPGRGGDTDQWYNGKGPQRKDDRIDPRGSSCRPFPEPAFEPGSPQPGQADPAKNDCGDQPRANIGNEGDTKLSYHERHCKVPSPPAAAQELYRLAEPIKARHVAGDEHILEDWRKLTTSDHLYYMCTKFWADGDVHKYFSPYDSPYDAYINFMNVLDNLRARAEG